MNPRRAYFPFLFFFSFAAILLYSYHYHSSVQFPQPESPYRLATRRRNPNTSPQGFIFTIKLLTFDRIVSLRRCLRSLAAADYGGDRVNLHILVDHFRAEDPANASAALLNVKLEESRQILDLIDNLDWIHGEKFVQYRTRNAGLQAQWLEAWWPVSDDDFAFVVEDDLEVSPLYYKYLKAVILNYYYDRSNYSPLIYGVSLQRPRFVAGKHGNKLHVDDGTRLFLYQMVGTWGQLLFPKPWKEFRLWYDEHKSKGLKPLLQGMVTTGWYKKIGDRIWTPWFIKFIHAKRYYNIYTNFLHDRALSVSHRDTGVNYAKTAGPDSKLLDKLPLEFDIWEMQPLKNLKWYNFCFKEIIPWRYVRSSDELGYVLGSMQKQLPVIIVSLYRTEYKLAKNLLCHLEALHVHNIIFIGRNLEILSDLASKGYAVIDSEKFTKSMKRYRLMGSKGFRSDMMKEMLAKLSVIKRCLELGYDSWVIDGNIIPLSGFLAEFPDPSCSVVSATDLEMIFVKKSQISSNNWLDDFISKVQSAAISLADSKLMPTDYKNFAYFSRNVLKDSGIGKVCTFEELMVGVKLGAETLNKTSLSGSKMMFWSDKLELDSIQRRLNKLEMWLIDDDLSCTSVVCHDQ
ncbi:hypothetical protein HPP92_025126 [Vanilla planifolia]|uniref:Uncharacterized protein n=1 Tax=Vanilla planifolia TaxID=51239 RepID=A0A835PIX9_VANPL|nr:hypothetical protein HPP92_025126 [Vanilla planifolia]